MLSLKINELKHGETPRSYFPSANELFGHMGGITENLRHKNATGCRATHAAVKQKIYIWLLVQLEGVKAAHADYPYQHPVRRYHTEQTQ